MPEHTNRLIGEASPYLRQHAHNPVDWFPWGPEAFAKARAEQKPIFLSIGYSTCHWCHVMAHESFEHSGIAALLNTHFVSIKVDREERPEVDTVYMSAVTAISGQGGWPLSVFLTPDLKPFFGGTYFPPETRYGATGFRELLEAVRDRWAGDRQALVDSSDVLTQALREKTGEVSSQELGMDTLVEASREWAAAFDVRHGGFGQAPKFPMGHVLSFFWRVWSRSRDSQMRTMAEQTLDAMAAGGIWDHVGGGFHRYATDERWQVPHFEKMLYDQAWLARAYLEGFQVTGKPAYAETARRILDYVLRDLRAPSGGFYGAEDADSLDPLSGHLREGAFYLWGYDELKAVLTAEEFRAAEVVFGWAPQGNAAYDPHGEFTEKNILAMEKSSEEAARVLGLRPEEVDRILTQVREKLFPLRAHRPRPHRDEKILTDWNGMMIAALALGGGVLDDAHYLDAAREAAGMILRDHRPDGGGLWHVLRGRQAPVPGNLGDYAFLIDGLLHLYEATFAGVYLQEAVGLGEEMVRRFADPQEGGFFFTDADGQDLILRPKDLYDGAMPSASAVAEGVLARLASMTHEDRWRSCAERSLQSGAAVIRQRPSAYTAHLGVLDFLLGPVDELVLAAADPEDFRTLARMTQPLFWPRRCVTALGEPQPPLLLQKLVSGQEPLNGQATLFWCRGQTCYPPLAGWPAITQALKARSPQGLA